MISAEKLSAELAALQPAAAAAVAAGKMLPDLIQTAENIVGPGNGTVKLDMVRTWVAGALEKVQVEAPIIEAAWAKLEPMVAILVTVFTKSPALASLLALTVRHQTPAA